MTAEKRGRPKKNTNTFDANGLITEYLSSKIDNYNSPSRQANGVADPGTHSYLSSSPYSTVVSVS